MSRRPDYPAAHSMDTSWFAVDRDGNLAHFESGEEAAVPEQITSQDQGDDVLEEIILRMPRRLEENGWGRHVIEPGTPEWDELASREFVTDCPPPRTLLGRLWRRLIARAPVRGIEGTDLPSMVLLLKDTSHFDECDRWFLKAGQPIEIRGERVTPTYISFLVGDDYRFLHESGTCVACAGDYTSRDTHARINTLGALGIFIYEASDYGNPPYDLISRPECRLRLEELPADVRAQAGKVRFENLAFADTEHLQPFEHLPCRTYGEEPDVTYLASDLKTRRLVPRRED